MHTHTLYFAGMGIVHENAHFCGSETDCGEKEIWGEGGTKKTGSICFSSTPNTHKIYRARSRT